MHAELAPGRRAPRFRPAAGTFGIRNLMPRRTPTRIALALAALLSIAAVVAGAVLLRQDVSVASAAQAPDVIFATGDDYAVINAAGFATLTVGSTGTSATLSLDGIPGAAALSLTDLMKVTNQDATQDYTLTLSRSAAPNAAITGMTFTVQNAADTIIATYNAATTGSSASFSLPASTTYDISVAVTIADGTAIGSLGSFTLQFELVPV
jgi:hypothetical protein